MKPNNTVGALQEWLKGRDPNEVYIGQLFLAENFGIEKPDGTEGLPSQDVMKAVDERFWADSMTGETWGWLAELVWEEAKKRGEVSDE